MPSFERMKDDSVEETKRQRFYDKLEKREKDQLENLLRCGGNAVDLKRHDHQSALHMVIDSKVADYPTSFLEVHFQDKIGAEMIELLLKYEAADVNAKNVHGDSALQIAVSCFNYDVVEVLLKHNADLRDIHFKGRYFERAGNVLPFFEAVQNLFGIIELFRCKGYDMNLTGELAVLNFLNGYNFVIDAKLTESILQLGSPLGIRKFFDSIITEFLNDCSNRGQYRKINIIRQIRRYLGIVRIGNMYINIEINDYLLKVIQTLQKDLLEMLWDETYGGCDVKGIEKEIELAKSTMMNNRASLLDICTISPERAYSLLSNSEYCSILNSKNFSINFPQSAGIIKGYIAKCLIRTYSKLTALKYLRILTRENLPDLCGYNIMKYLTNEELLTMCKAVLGFD
ncbi:uncharacterized protein LOC106650434 isoform X1 [Trichogramma pretiosum]|uniref:uncharacterized protein LOC106650434 isoform X1 n=1 Tax=Trichogramma pretiosum TaxID=7493 RepID=UPI0006C981D8|nr:uncharacterized protein LOC106650434 isoform X1 [Trichogramma pretiosum]